MSFGAGEFIKDLGILKKVMEEERSNKILWNTNINKQILSDMETN